MASEAAIIQTIRNVFPDHAILAEESGQIAGTGDHRWIVDPLDGTKGFSRGGTSWGPLVAYEYQGEVLAGATALPALGEFYWAAKGLGAYRSGVRLQVSSVTEWQDATLSVGELQKLLRSPLSDRTVPLFASTYSTRCYGDIASCIMLLNGRADAWIETGVKVWDLAALKILVEEAGGVFTDFEGRATAESGQAVAAKRHLHGHVLTCLRGG